MERQLVCDMLAQIKTVNSLWKRGLDPKEIAECTGLTKTRVKEILLSERNPHKRREIRREIASRELIKNDP